MRKTKIEWCDSTWNPVSGCYHNCRYCYAMGIATRFGGADESRRKFIEGANNVHTMLDCGIADLKMLEDVELDWSEVFRGRDGFRNFNKLIEAVVLQGKINLHQRINDRIAELADDLDEDCQETNVLRQLDPFTDIESFHNYIDTHVYFVKNNDFYKKYLKDAVEQMEYEIGFEIS